jgi:CDP-glycerol glycerophosphotransferase (TagB/SpsB family)
VWIEISSTQVSRMTQELDVDFEKFRNRSLGFFSYVILDAIYLKVRHNGTVRSQAVLIAYGVNIFTYCPTHRDLPTEADHEAIYSLVRQFHLHFPEDDYTLFIRLHPIRRQELDRSIIDEKKVVDVSDYHDTQEILVSSDVLITDYSSIIFDYAILERPIYLMRRKTRSFMAVM